MNKQLMNAYDKLKMNLIQSPIAFDLLHELIMHPNVATLNELIKYDSELVSIPDGTELTTEILNAVSEVCHVSGADIFSKCRKREFNDARIIYLTFVRKGTTWTLMKIARHISRNHATIIHAMKTFESLIATDPRFKKKVNQIIELLNSKKIYTFDDLLTTNKWKYERTNDNLERGARIARSARRFKKSTNKRKSNPIPATIK